MKIDTLLWIILAALALALELSGLFGLGEFRPLTTIVRGEMSRSTMFVGVLFVFLAWLLFHFMVQTYLPRTWTP